MAAAREWYSARLHERGRRLPIRRGGRPPPVGVAALARRRTGDRAFALRALLGPLHHPAAGLSRLLPPGRAGRDVPAVPCSPRLAGRRFGYRLAADCRRGG